MALRSPGTRTIRWGLVFLAVFVLALFSPERAFAAAPDPGDSAAASPAPTPAPAPTPNPPLSQTQQPVNITNRFIFETSTLSGAVERTVQKDSEKFSQGIEAVFADLVSVANRISDASSFVVDYADVSRKYFPVAAAVAPLFFVLRLLVYQWSRLGGDQDSIPSVVLDYATAVIFALLIGPLANLIHKFVYWLPANFGLGSITLPSVLMAGLSIGINSYGVFFTAIMVALYTISLFAIAAFLIGYLSAFVVLYVVAAIGPIVAVVSVVPQLRWIRNTIIKVTGLVMLLPLLGLVVMKSVQSIVPQLNIGGFFPLLARTVLYAGAASIMFSAATVIGKFSWGAMGEGIKGTVRAIGAGVLAATTGGAGAAVGAVGGTAAVGASGGAAASGGISASSAVSAAAAAGSSATAAEAASAGTSWLSAGIATGFSPGTRFVVSSLGTFMGIPHAASAMMRPAPTPSPSAIASARAREFARLNYYDRETESALAGILERTNPNEHEAIANAFHGTLNVLGKQKEAADNVFVITARAYPFQTADFLRGVAEGRDPLDLLGSLDEKNPLRAILRTSTGGSSSSPDEPPDGLYPDSAD